MFDNKEILVVEDTMTQMLIIEGLLSSCGFRVACAANPQEALDWLQDNNARTVLTDISMPGMNGYELCKSLRQDPRFNSIPVILMESLKDETSLGRILKAGADGFIYKDFEEDYFIPMLTKIIDKYQTGETSNAQLDLLIDGSKISVTSKQLEIVLLAAFNTSVYCAKKLELLV